MCYAYAVCFYHVQTKGLAKGRTLCLIYVGREQTLERFYDFH